MTRCLTLLGLMFLLIRAPLSASFTEDSTYFMERFFVGASAVREDSTVAMEVYHQLEAFADSLNDPFFQIKVQRLYALYLEHWGQMAAADSVFGVMIESSKNFEDEQNLYSAYAGRASNLYQRGLMGQALEYYFLAVQLAEKRHDSLNLSRIYNNLSLVQNKLEDHSGSLTTLRKSIALKRALGDQQGLADNYLNLGNVFAKQLQKDSALTSYQEAKRLYLHTGDTLDARLINQNIGELLYHLGENQQAIEYINAAITIREDRPPSLEYLIGLTYRGNILNKLGQPKRALADFEKVEAILGDQYHAPLIKEISRGKADAYMALSDFEQAAHYLMQLRDVEQELNEEQELELQEKYEAMFLTKEQESRLKVSAIELEAQRSSTRLWIIIGGAAILVAILAAILFILNRKRSQLLRERNGVMEKSLREREVLLREIHHRVKNNLQIISSMLSMQSRRVKDEQAKSGMLDSQNRVKSMSLIHEHLYRVDDLSHVEMHEYLDKLLVHIYSSFNTDQIHLNKDLEKIQLDIDTAVTVGLVMNEAVTNAFKHAFPPGQKGTINVALHQKEHYLELCVEDNGVGIGSGQPQASSFGMTMMRAFAESLEGELLISGNNSTSLTFLFPIAENT